MLTALAGCGKAQKQANSYEELIPLLEEAVNGLFSKDFEDKVNEGKLPSPTGEHEEKWKAMLLSAKANFTGVDENAYGYRLIDINADGNAELLFTRSDDQLLAVFTVHGDKVVMLDAYSVMDYLCVLMDTGELYSMNVDTSGGYQYQISALNPSTASLFVSQSFGTENGICYESVEGTIYTTSEERIKELRQKYPFKHGTAFLSAEFNLF